MKILINAIIVTYNPDADIVNNVAEIMGQVAKVIIVDNGSDDAIIAVLRELKSQYGDGLELILNDENIGLGAAQNLGLTKALQGDAEWILLMDDDSKPKNRMIDIMMESYEAHDNKEKIAIIAPYIEEQNAQIEPKYITSFGRFLFLRRSFGESKILDDILSCIASGSLVKASIIKELGQFRQEFFIDYIDTEFCLRAVANNYKIIAVRDAILQHHLGNKKLHNIAGAKIPTSNHSSQRRFTIYRNRVWVWREYIFKTTGYIIYDILASFYDILRVILLEKGRLAKLKMMAKGLATGLLKKP